VPGLGFASIDYNTITLEGGIIKIKALLLVLSFLIIGGCSNGEVGDAPMILDPDPVPIPTNMPIPTPTPMPTPEPLPPMNPELDEFQQAMLDAVNTARMQARTCGSTNFGPTTPVNWNKAIQSSTLMHSIDMNDNGFFSHTGSDGLNTGDRLTRVGYAWRGWGENIAFGFSDIDSVMNDWLNSAGHCANIMNPNWEEMGVSEFNHYWTQVFAIPLR